MSNRGNDNGKDNGIREIPSPQLYGTRDIPPSQLRVENPADPSEPFVLTTNWQPAFNEYTEMAANDNVSINKATLLESLSCMIRMATNQTVTNAALATRATFARLNIVERGSVRPFTTANNIAATRILALGNEGPVPPNRIGQTIDDYQPPHDATGQRMPTYDFTQQFMWPINRNRTTNAVELHVYPTTTEAYEVVRATYETGSVEQLAIANARLGEWDRSTVAVAAAAGLVSESLRLTVSASYREEQDATRAGWNLADTLVDVMNRRVTGQSSEQRAVTTALIRRVTVDRSQIAADVERLRARIAELGSRGLAACNSREVAAARTAAVMSMPRPRGGRVTGEPKTPLTATGYASEALPSTSPSRSEAQAAAWDATAAIRDHALSTIIRAWRGRSGRAARLMRAAVDRPPTAATREAAISQQGQRGTHTPESAGPLALSPAASNDADRPGDGDVISDTELYSWLELISRSSPSARAETAGMMLDATGAGILREGVVEYKRSLGPGGTALAVTEAHDVMTYMLARLRRHLVRPARTGPFTSPPKRAESKDGERRSTADEDAAHKAGREQPSPPMAAAEPDANERTRGAGDGQSISYEEVVAENRVVFQLEGSDELWVADHGYGDSAAPLVPCPGAEPRSSVLECRGNEQTTKAVRKADKKMARSARAASRGGAGPDDMPDLISASTTDYSSSDDGASSNRMPALTSAVGGGPTPGERDRVYHNLWGRMSSHEPRPWMLSASYGRKAAASATGGGPAARATAPGHVSPPEAREDNGGLDDCISDPTATDRVSAATTGPPGAGTREATREQGSISSSSGGSDCTSSTVPPRNASGQRVYTRHGPPAAAARRVDAYMFTSSPTGSVEDGGPGVTNRSASHESRVPTRSEPRGPHASMEDRGCDDETSQPVSARHNSGWQEFYEGVRTLDSRQPVERARPHYVRRHYSRVPYGVNATVDRYASYVDADTDVLNTLLERLDTLHLNGAASPGSPDRKAATGVDKEVDKIVRAIRRQHTILNRSVEVANSTVDMYLCNIRNFESEHWGGGVDNRTRPFLGEPSVAREMARTVIATPMHPVTDADLEAHLTTTPVSPPEDATVRETGPFTSPSTYHHPSAEHIARVEREDAKENARYAKDVDARARVKDAEERKSDPPAQWSDHGYNPRDNLVVTRSATGPSNVTIGMLRTVDSVQKAAWRADREMLNKEARARGVTATKSGWTGNPTAPQMPLASSPYATNESDHRCPNCFEYHPDPKNANRTVWYKCPAPWDETCWDKHNKREERLQGRRTRDQTDRGARPDIAVLMAVLDLLPHNITENIQSAQEMISSRGTDGRGSAPPLDELARCVEKIKLWVDEGAEAVTIIAANLRGRSSRISHAQGRTDRPIGRPQTTPRGHESRAPTCFELADTFAHARSPRPTHQHQQQLSAGAQRLVMEMVSPAMPQRPNTRAHTRLVAEVGRHNTAGFGWPRVLPSGAAITLSATVLPTWDRQHDTDDDNDRSMEEYVVSMLETPVAPAAPRLRGRVSGVPGPVHEGPRTRSASAGTLRPSTRVQTEREDQPTAPITQTLSEQPVWGRNAVDHELRALGPSLAQWGV